MPKRIIDLTENTDPDPALSFLAIDSTAEGTEKVTMDTIRNEAFGVMRIKTQADFPVQDADVIDLGVAEKWVFIGQNIAITKQFKSDGPVEIVTENFIEASLIVTIGALPLFFATDCNGFKARDIRINCTDGLATLFDLTSLGTFPQSYVLIDSILTIEGFTSPGTIKGFNNVGITNTDMADFDDGITFDDNNNLFTNTMIFNRNNTAAGTDITIKGGGIITLDKTRFSKDINTTALHIDSASTVSDGKVINGNWVDPVGGFFTDPAGKDRTDPNWEFDRNGAAKDSRNIASTYVAITQTITVAAANVFYEIGGTDFVTKLAERFSISTSGVITYDGINPIDVLVTAVATIQKVGGGADILQGRIAKNWTTADPGEIDSAAGTQNATPTSVPMQTLLEIVNGDNIRVIFTNNSSSLLPLCWRLTPYEWR